MDAVTRHSWFLGMTSLSLFKGIRDKPITKIAFEVLVIVLFFAFTVKTESFITHYIVQPLFKRLFGDNEQLRREIEKKEEDLRKLFDEQRRNKNQLEGTSPKRKEPIEVD